VRAIAYMESIVLPRRWQDLPEDRVQIFKDLRSRPGERMVLEQNFFVEKLLPRLVLRPLGEVEMEAYRRPFPNRESRLPTLVWPRELPIEGEPADVVAIVEDYGRWMATSSVPKLFINAEPGSLLIGRSRDFCRTWPNQHEISVRGIHFIQEDSPNEIGVALANFARSTSAC
jgi:haloalkane dehalogenase